MRGLPYYGGKARLASTILEHIPPHTVYVEPFAGGASVLFAKGVSPVTNSDYYREVINDKDERIVNLYRHLRDNPELCRLLQMTPCARAEHYRAKNIVEPEGLEAAWGLFVNLSMSFSSVINRGLSTGCFGKNHAATWRRRIDEIGAMASRLKCAFIECDDAIDVIKRWDSPQTCFYCDPPYPGADQGYREKCSLSEYQTLCDLLDSIEGSFVLSCYAQGFEPKRWEHHKSIAHCSASAKGKALKPTRARKATPEELGDRRRVESLFVMDRSATTRPDLIEQLWSPSKGFVYRDGRQQELF